jgi:hypothetical protein
MKRYALFFLLLLLSVNARAAAPTATSTWHWPTPFPTYTYTPTKSPTPTKTYTPTRTYSPTRTYTHTLTHTVTETNTPENTATDTPTETPTDTPTATPTDTGTDTVTATDTETETITPTPTETYTPAGGQNASFFLVCPNGDALGGAYALYRATPGFYTSWNNWDWVIQPGMEALPNVGSGNITVKVTGDSGVENSINRGYTITFIGALGYQPITDLWVQNSDVYSADCVNEQQSITTDQAPDAGSVRFIIDEGAGPVTTAPLTYTADGDALRTEFVAIGVGVGASTGDLSAGITFEYAGGSGCKPQQLATPYDNTLSAGTTPIVLTVAEVVNGAAKVMATVVITPLQAGEPVYTPTETPSETPTDTPTNTPTNTPTATPTDTPTDTPTATPTDTETLSPTATPTHTKTFTPTATPTQTQQFDATSTPVIVQGLAEAVTLLRAIATTEADNNAYLRAIATNTVPSP